MYNKLYIKFKLNKSDKRQKQNLQLVCDRLRHGINKIRQAYSDNNLQRGNSKITKALQIRGHKETIRRISSKIHSLHQLHKIPSLKISIKNWTWNINEVKTFNYSCNCTLVPEVGILSNCLVEWKIFDFFIWHVRNAFQATHFSTEISPNLAHPRQVFRVEEEHLADNILNEQISVFNIIVLLAALIVCKIRAWIFCSGVICDFGRV